MTDAIAPSLLLIGFLVIGLAVAAVWILTLINSAKTSQWAWFVFILIFGPLVSLLYYGFAYQTASPDGRIVAPHRQDVRRAHEPAKKAPAR